MLVVLAACGDDGSAGTPDAGAMTAPPDYETLLTCDVPEPCPRSSAQTAEVFPLLGTEAFACVMRAFAARAPGRYFHDYDSTNTATSNGQRNVFIVGADGSVLHALERYSSGAVMPHSETFEPARRCALKPASYFEACAVAAEGFMGHPDDPAWQCVFEDWLEQCVEEPLLSCE